MKCKLKIVFMLVVMFFLSGSYRHNGLIEVNEDKSVDIEIIYAVDNSKIEDMLNLLNEGKETKLSINNLYDEADIRKIYEDAGFDVSEYTEIIENYNWEGLKATKHYNSIEDITSESEVYFLLNKKSNTYDVLDDNIIFGSGDENYIAKFLVYMDFNFEPGLFDYKNFSNDIDVKYIVKLPKKVIETNASDVSDDGKVLTWELEMGNKNELNFNFDLPEQPFLVKNKNIIIIGSAGLLFIVILIIIFMNKPKRKLSVDVSNNDNNYKPLDAISLTDINNQDNNNQNM